MTTVLLVDDSPTILMSMSAILTKQGFVVRTATDGADALKKVAGGAPNLVISDLNMPGMDGMTFLREVRKVPGMRFTPVLILTTESQASKREEARAAGATGWLVKPVDADSLLGVIRQVVPGA
jgi:two-component system chemotaxis response regulator CheY